jgi:hypothetical protein
MANRHEPYRFCIVKPGLLFDDVIISLWPDVSRLNGVDPILTVSRGLGLIAGRSPSGAAT